MQADVEALGYVVEMGQVLAPIYRRMQERITLLTETSLNNLYLADDGITLNITRQGKPQHLHASLVVGVDGTSSQVRTLAGIGTYGWDYNHFGLVASVKTGNGHGDMAYECFCASGPLAFLPLADGRASIVWALTPKEAACMMAMPEPMFLRRLERAAGEDVATQLGRFGSIGKRACFPLELRIAEQFSRTRIALAGNAAHTVHPVAGQGMNLGLRDVAVLGDVLRHKLARNDPGAPVLMRAYAERRRLDTVVVCSFTDSLATGFGSSLPPAKCLRGLGMKGMHMLSPLRDLLLKQAAGIGQMDTLNLQLAKQESSA
jgi:ubiquinone biosynthesis UbiH/UbiF/VisC/COQ6 family hydroxylase